MNYLCRLKSYMLYLFTMHQNNSQSSYSYNIVSDHTNFTIAQSDGPVPTQDTGICVCFQINLMQLIAYLGRCSAFVIFVMSVCQPFNVSYTTYTLANSYNEPGRLSSYLPFSLQATATLISLNVSKISSFVRLRDVYPFTK